MRKPFRGLLVCLTLSLPQLLHAADTIVVDNPEAEFTGAWTLATAANDRYGSNYKFGSTTDNSNPTASATYKPNLPAAGNYHVDISFPQGDNRATNSQWIITYDGGTDKVSVNQRVNGGQWIRIAADKPFAAGQKGFARLLNNTGSTGAVVVADAVRFVPVVPGAPTALTLAPSAASSEPTPTPTPPAPVSSNGKGFTVTVHASSGGIVQKNPDRSTYAGDSVVTLTAVPAEGFVFEGWTGDQETLKNPLKIGVRKNVNLRANFAAAGIGVIMDNTDPGVDFRGTWAQSPQAYKGTRYENHHSTSGVSSKPTAWATYTPDIPKSGRYDVYVWYARGDNRTSAADWVVAHKGGNANSSVNQKARGGEWVQIASGVEFEAGAKQNQYARLSNYTADGAGVVVIADAVAFVYTGP